MIELLQQIMSLPIDFLVTLTGGFLAYKLAFIGRERYNGTWEKLFWIAVFGLISKTMYLEIGKYVSSLAASVFAVLAPVVLGYFWRIKIGEWLKKALRGLNISHSDPTETALESLIWNIERHTISEFEVVRKDGSSLICHNLSEFENHAHGPCLIGNDGSIGVYATYFYPVSSNQARKINSEDVRFTIIPSENIQEIKMKLAENKKKLA